MPWRAPQNGTVGLRNPASCDPVRERDDKVFGERYRATTGFFCNTDADDFFPNNDYFPDVNNIFGDMNTDGANGSSSNTPYVLICVLLDIVLKTIVIAICVELLLAYSLELLLAYSLNWYLCIIF